MDPFVEDVIEFANSETFGPILRRILAYEDKVLAEGGRLYNRDKRDVTFEFPEVRVHPDVVLVGQLVILKEGVSQFNLLARRKTNKPKENRLRSMIYPATLVAFDVLEVHGTPLVDRPLRERRKILEDLASTEYLPKGVFVAWYWGCQPEKVQEYLQLMRDQNAEGIIVVEDLSVQPTLDLLCGFRRKAITQEAFLRADSLRLPRGDLGKREKADCENDQADSDQGHDRRGTSCQVKEYTRAN